MPAEHTSVAPDDSTYSGWHPGTHVAPSPTIAPVPHVTEFATVGRGQGLGVQVGAAPLHEASAWQTNDAGDPTGP